jgi:hypothetical protein
MGSCLAPIVHCNRGNHVRISISRKQSMISKFHLFAAGMAGVLVCSVAGAQMRNDVKEPPVRSSPVRPRPAPRAFASPIGPAATGPQAGQQARVIQISPTSNARVTSGVDPIVSSVSFDGVPGLGFDYPHLAAISRGQNNNSSPHFSHNAHRGQDFFVPIFFGGYPYYSNDFGYDQPEQQPVQQQPQPQIIVIQQPVPAQQTADAGVDTSNLSASVPASQPSEPIPDVGNFILVRRDGRILFASAFSVVGTQLQYVTPEGIRRTVAVSELDPDATQQMNEARGTTVRIQN